MTHDETTPTPDGQGATGEQAPTDAKARFRAALERKNEQAHRSAEGRRNTGAVHGSEVSGGRRTFRRKTG